ncbi:MAG: FAD-dependent thymidylate synthase [Candidatus Lokiarchaeota archaeon]|nr:FAD-dependent thymidylate synthase [Candidatus Lokiarchaeota archaeon]
MKPINAKDLIELDKNLEVVVLQCYPIPEQVVYQAGKCDYSETPIHSQTIPKPSKCGEWIVEQLLSNDKGHWGPLEHPAITFSVCGYVHSVMAQARTHRVGISFDVQSQRYTGKRVVKVANEELKPEDVFYVRPPGFYVNRTGKKYDWTQEDYEDELKFIVEGCKRYAVKYEKGVCEEHIRDYLAQAIRQNFVVSFNLRSVLHFIDLRAKLDAQLEIQALCEQTIPYLRSWAPNVWKYYEEKRLHRARLSP